ncbi:MAG: sulfurtransferase complex subunit TusB [Methylococcales bacterium]
MSVLYIANTSETDSFKRCLQRLTNDDALLLIESAVTVVNAGHLVGILISEYTDDKNIYVLEPDLLARGIQLSNQPSPIQLIDYDGFVRLSVEHHLSCYLK